MTTPFRAGRPVDEVEGEVLDTLPGRKIVTEGRKYGELKIGVLAQAIAISPRYDVAERRKDDPSSSEVVTMTASAERLRSWMPGA